MIALEELLSLLPADLLDRLALEHKVDANNQARLPGGTVFVCLLNGLLNHGDLTLRLLEETYRQHTGRHCDHSSFGKRLAAIKPDYFAAILAHLHRQWGPQATPGEARALRLRRVDATVVSLPAKLLGFGLTHGTRKGKADRRAVKTVMELRQDGLPRLLRVCREQAEANDCVALGEAMQEHRRPGDLWVFDRGVHSRERLRSLSMAGAFFLTPHSTQGVRVVEALWHSGAAAPARRSRASCWCAPRGSCSRTVRPALRSGGDGSRCRWCWSTRCASTRARQWKPLALMTNLPASPDGRQAGPTPSASWPNCTGAGGTSRPYSRFKISSSAWATGT